MKIEELRIGNLITDVWAAGQPFPVSMISNTYPVVKYGIDLSSNIDNVVGIPLTEEWLLNFGASKANYNTFGIKFSKYSLHTLYVTITKSDNIATIGDSFTGKEHLCVFTMPLVNYVHQLQNLYFALTGEELILSEQAPQSLQE